MNMAEDAMKMQRRQHTPNHARALREKLAQVEAPGGEWLNLATEAQAAARSAIQKWMGQGSQGHKRGRQQ